QIRPTTIFFTPTPSKSTPLKSFSRQPPANPRHSIVFRANHQQIHATPKFFAPTPSKSTPLLSFSRRTSHLQPPTIPSTPPFKNCLPFLNRLHYLYILNFYRFYF